MAEFTEKDDYAKDCGENIFYQDAFRSYNDSIGIQSQKAMHCGSLVTRLSKR